MEAYDISNISGFESVGSMVVYEKGKPKRSDYRKFKIKWVQGPNDYASMEEVLTRRFTHEGKDEFDSFSIMPDLILMDGGRGQVNIALKVLEILGIEIPVCGMVKDDHHRTRAIVDSEGREIAINMNRGTFTFITAIQDETHRFANAYRKQQMKQKSYSSTLTEIPGIGPKTAKALMAQFKSVTAVKEATPDQLENTPGVGKQTAQIIYAYFHE
jgi:excinuclease ABC subunit C